MIVWFFTPGEVVISLKKFIKVKITVKVKVETIEISPNEQKEKF